MSADFELTTDRRRYRESDTVVFHIPELKWRPRFLFPKKLPHQVWVAWSMECEENHPRLKDRAFMQWFDLTMLHQLNSDVPLPYSTFHGTAEAFERELRKPPAGHTERAPAVMLISSRFDRSGRRAYARELMRLLEIDSYGKFMRNRKIENDTGRASKHQTIARYKFTLAFENAIGHDYVTEKFFDPLAFGSVPVYLGTPNIKEFAPGEHCYINVNDYSGPQALAEYLNHLAHDDSAFNAYFGWKHKPFRVEFQNLLKFSRPSALARLCNAIRQRRGQNLSPLVP